MTILDLILHVLLQRFRIFDIMPLLQAPYFPDRHGSSIWLRLSFAFLSALKKCAHWISFSLTYHAWRGIIKTVKEVMQGERSRLMNTIEMRKKLNLSRAAFSRLYKIPVRTLEDWESGRRTPPDYVLHLLSRVVEQDISHPENLLTVTVERQIEEMKKATDPEDIINNRFL